MIFAGGATPWQTCDSMAPVRAVSAAQEHLDFLSTLPPVPCREDLAILAQAHFVQTGKAVEIGVYQGMFSHHNLLHWQGEYYAVDAWSFRPGDPPDKNFRDAAINDRNYDLTVENTKVGGARVHLIRGLSTQAASQFEDGSFDWIFVDALHTYRALQADLKAWWPKLRVGGLMSGDDYGDRMDTELVGRHRNRSMSAPDRGGSYWVIPTTYNWGVQRAVGEFARQRGAVLHVSWLKGFGLLEHREPTCYTWNAWYMVKPPPRVNASRHQTLD